MYLKNLSIKVKDRDSSEEYPSFGTILHRSY